MLNLSCWGQTLSFSKGSVIVPLPGRNQAERPQIIFSLSFEMPLRHIHSDDTVGDFQGLENRKWDRYLMGPA